MAKDRKKLKKAKANKGPRVGSHDSRQVNYDTLKPIFSFEHMQPGFCVENCNTEHQAAFAYALWKRSQLPWIQLKATNRHKLGYETIDKPNQSFPPQVSNDARMIAFRLKGNDKTMIGYRDKQVFHIVWIDLDGKIYSHG